ncbi:hypothetical protein CPB83DRAFT_864189 [Crepidotus variabilis]|uniref:F-box domain-containing protein n=1 Tax=Crepidotus variabilis TaxID=179855 RepID=A0A9P6E557_9AGAR|nr:hypothetical protein CPB83DRAFT_864189 [Crepidotus variabilis]
MTAITVDIPPELWQLIAFYLTDDQIWALRGKNRMLNNLAWDRQCYQISFPITIKSLSERHLRHLERPFISERIHEILLADYLYGHSFLERIFVRGIAQSRASALSQRVRGLLKQSNPFKRLSPMLKNVSSMQIHWSMWASNHLAMALTKRALLTVQLFSEKLRFLTISLDPTPTSELLKSTYLPQLESLTLLRHSRMEYVALSTTMNETILPFLGRHHKTLKSFHSPRSGTFNMWYPESLQMSSDGMPLFESLSLSFWCLQNGIHQTVHDFIASHSQSLNSLTLFVCANSIAVPPELLESPQTYLDLNLPHLTHLIVEHVRSSGEDCAIWFYRLANSIAHACSETLIQLVINGGGLAYASEQNLACTVWTNLKVLSIFVYELDVQELDFMANIKLFPTLEELNLMKIWAFGASTNSTFEADLSRRKYKRSKLRYLHAQTPLKGQMANFKALVNTFPNLLLFNDVPKVEFLENHNDERLVLIHDSIRVTSNVS